MRYCAKWNKRRIQANATTVGLPMSNFDWRISKGCLVAASGLVEMLDSQAFHESNHQPIDPLPL
jgi:hypothetical protein